MIKRAAAEKYRPTYQSILQEIAKGSLVHADETKEVVKGGGHYVWVFTNLTTGRIKLLRSLRLGTMPSAKVFDTPDGDINEDLHKNPFDDELKEIARSFGVLIREIVGTIDAYGLKARHLGKHNRSAARFIKQVSAMKCSTVALRYRRRVRCQCFCGEDEAGAHAPGLDAVAEHIQSGAESQLRDLAHATVSRVSFPAVDGVAVLTRYAVEAKAQKGDLVGFAHATLLFVDLKPHAPLQETPNRCHDALPCALAANEDVGIIGVANEPELPPRQFAIQFVEDDVGKQRRERTSDG